jgi:DNA-binding SARP family transcriptional activator
VLLSRGADEIALSAEAWWCDATAFEAAVHSGRHEDALDLYRGELLEGFFVSNAPGFERWLDEERRRVGELASRTAWSLADVAERHGDRATAARWCQWAVDRAPLDEPGVQRKHRRWWMRFAVASPDQHRLSSGATPTARRGRAVGG